MYRVTKRGHIGRYSCRGSPSDVSLFAKMVAYGEAIIGLALILGMFTGIAALFGGFMNWDFMMAGSTSTNPMLFVAVGLILA